MAWKTGSITSATPDAALSDILKTDAALLNSGTPPTGIRNWSFVENVPAGTSAGQSGSASYSVDVYKCAGSGNDANDAGVDWYIGLTRSSTGSVWMWVFESYLSIAANPAHADRGKSARPAGCYQQNCVTPDATNWTYDETYRTFAARATGVYQSYGLAQLNTTGFTYGIKVTKNDIVFPALISSNNECLGAGLMDSMIATGQSYSDTMPLVGWSMGTNRWAVSYNNAVAGGFSRLPGVTQTDINNSALYGSGGNNIWGATFAPWTRNVELGGNSAGLKDKWQAGKAMAVRVGVFHKDTTATSGTYWQYIGWVRGLLKSNLLVIRNTVGTVNIFDTLTVNGQADWVVIAKASGFLGGYPLVTRAA